MRAPVIGDAEGTGVLAGDMNIATLIAVMPVAMPTNSTVNARSVAVASSMEAASMEAGGAK